MLPLFFLFCFLSEDLGTKAADAKQALGASDYPRAISLYRELSVARPQDLAIKANLGLAFQSSGQYARALEQFNLVLQGKPDHRAALLFSGIDLLKLKKTGAAIERLSSFLLLDRDNQIALLELGRAHQTAGDFPSAVDVFRRLCALDPANPQVWYSLGTSYWSSAKSDFEWIEMYRPFTAEWYALHARSQLQQERYNEAFQEYREALSRSPQLLAVHTGLAEVYRRTGHPDWASIEEAREADPNQSDRSPASDLHYLHALENQQKAYEALNHLGEMPESVELHELLGRAYRMQQLDQKSTEEFRRALTLDPTNSKIEQELATSLWLSREFEAAAPILDRLIKVSPNSPELNHLLGDCFLQQNQPAKAIPLLDVAVRSGESLPAEASLGRAYLHSGQYAKAVTHLTKALPLHYTPVLFQLAEAHRKLGHNSEAAEYMAEFKLRSEASRETRVSQASIQISPP